VAPLPAPIAVRTVRGRKAGDLASSAEINAIMNHEASINVPSARLGDPNAATPVPMFEKNVERRTRTTVAQRNLKGRMIRGTDRATSTSAMSCRRRTTTRVPKRSRHYVSPALK